MGTVSENKQQKKERLLETAFSLFTSRGMAKTSISDIAKEAGVAKGTFYLYFRDKYDLGNKLIARKTSSLFQHALTTLEHSDAQLFEDKLIVIIDDVLGQLNSNPILLRFINKNLSWGIFQSALHHIEDTEDVDYLAVFNNLIQSDQDVEWIESKLMLYTIIELVGSTCHSVILDKNPTDLEHYKPFLYNHVRSIVRNHQKPKK